MKLLVAALEALQFAQNRYHELVSPTETIAEHVKSVAVATAEHVKVLEARLATAEAELANVSAILDMNLGSHWRDAVKPPAVDPAVEAAVDEKRAELSEVPPAPPVTPIAIPLSPELQQSLDATAPTPS